jgi:hypothetical protein
LLNGLIAGKSMTDHHRGGAQHPSSIVPSSSMGFPSLIRLSAVQRLAISGGLIALIWAAFFWATR